MLTPLFISRAKGARLIDVDGNSYIDFSGGIGATNSGHGNPEITAAIKEQAGRFLHTCFTVAGYEHYVALCERLNRLVKTGARNKSALFNSGAEAVENAVKIARRSTGRPAVVSFEYGFHGRTLLALSLTGRLKPYKEGFGPFAPETYKLEYPYVYRKPASCQTEAEYIDQLLSHIEGDFFKGIVAPENIAAVVMELVVGEGGFIVAPKRYVRSLARLCRQHGILLIIDEVQTGFARTGRMFAYEHYGIRPDLIVTAKSLSNGMPLSAVTGKKAIMDSVQPGGLGGTFSGNPVSCAAALAAIDFIRKKNLAHRAQRIGLRVMRHFRGLQQAVEQAGDARGLGAMCALELVKDKRTKQPDEGLARATVRYAYQNGLLLLNAGLLGNALRTLMPLTITSEDLDSGLALIGQSINEAIRRR